MGKNRDEKYSGSCEAIAKLIYSVTTNKLESMQALFKTIVMSYLLKNGDAHLKNFGVLYDKDFKEIKFSPAYDIVNTCVYIYKDRPALTMFGQKIWFGKKDLIRFGIQCCFIPKKEVLLYYETCITSLKSTVYELKKYVEKDENFKDIGQKMIDTWSLSLDEKKYKEIPDEIIRNWSKDKRA